MQDNSQLHEEDPFRAYSERTVDGATFVWSPYMDLLAFFPSESPGNSSVMVWRLINDKQTNSPLLFTEKIPFEGTALSWVPDRRSLCVGDVMGNVFVYDAERQRTIELQKVHEGAISSLHWTDLGVIGNKFTLRFLSAHSKLPEIYPIPSSIQNWVEEYDACSSNPIICDSLACSNRFSILSVLGLKGGVSLYVGGSIPVCEFHVSSLFGRKDAVALDNFFSESATKYLTMKSSPLMDKLAILETNSESKRAQLIIADSSVFRFRQNELLLLSRAEGRIHWLLKQLTVFVNSTVRLISPVIEEFYTTLVNPLMETLSEVEMADSMRSNSLEILLKLLVLRDPTSGSEIPQEVVDHLTKQWTVRKLSKIEKSMVNALDFASACLVSHLGVLVDHLQLSVCELVDFCLNGGPKSVIFGIPNLLMSTIYSDVAELRSQLNNLIIVVQRNARIIFPHLFANLAQCVARAAGETVTSPVQVSRDMDLSSSKFHFSSLRGLSNLSTLLACGRKIESSYTTILSHQRRAMGKLVSLYTLVDLGSSFGSGDEIKLEWSAETILNLVWVNKETNALVVGQVDSARKSSSQTTEIHSCQRVMLFPPSDMTWSFPRLYKDYKILALLKKNNQSQTLSVARVDVSEFFKEMTNLSALSPLKIFPNEYGVAHLLSTQQLPNGYLDVTGFEVCPERGLCSVLSSIGNNQYQRIITLDLEPNFDECDEPAESDTDEMSPETNAKSKSWIDENKFFNRRGSDAELNDSHEPFLKPPRDSPEIGNFF